MKSREDFTRSRSSSGCEAAGVVQSPVPVVHGNPLKASRPASCSRPQPFRLLSPFAKGGIFPFKVKFHQPRVMNSSKFNSTRLTLTQAAASVEFKPSTPCAGNRPAASSGFLARISFCCL